MSYMRFYKGIFIVLWTITLSISCPGLLYAATEPKVMHWTVGGIEREALVYIPESARQIPAPVVFVFHGHGGNMRQILRGKELDKLWPEAIIISPQGLNTPGQLTDPNGLLPGWQSSAGNMNDRDLLFFDAMLQTLRNEYKIDDKRVYATGHSNGGGFTYLLMETRSEVLAAAAPSAAAAIRALPRIKPKPMMHIIGEQDPLVKPEWQQMTINGMLKLNHCSSEGKPYATDANALIYASATGNPVIVYKHKGGHVFPQEAVVMAIQFFKSIARP